jgi:peptide/nickel transport system substrate-binding protein
MPKHYLKQFHANYRDVNELTAEAKKAGFNAWNQLYIDKARWHSNHEVPMESAWMPKNSWSSPHRIFERNPYYWKVDTHGRQLPYIDRVTHDNIQDRATLLFRLMSGDVLMQTRHVSFKDLPLFDNAIKKDKVKMLEWRADGNLSPYVVFNQCYMGKDAFIGDLLREKRFRFALSYALPRKEISELFFFGMGTPAQNAPIEGSPYYEYGRKYAETAIDYDLDHANRLLDELGLAARDSDGYRLRPDGKPLALTVDHRATTENAQMAEYFTQRCLKPLGIKGVLKPSTGSRLATGKHQLVFSESAGGNTQLLISPGLYIPDSIYNNWGGQYGLWVQAKGARGWKPTGDIARILEIYDEIQTCPVQEKRYELMGQIIDLHAENLWSISSVEGIPVPVVVSPRSGNVPENIVASWYFYTPSNAHPEQFYLKW